MFWEYSILITALIGAGGGLTLMIGAVSKKSSAARWAKIALFIAGLFLSLWGGLVFVKSNYETALNTRNLRLIEHYKTILGGVGMGILITLFISGELRFKKWQKKRIKDNDKY